MQPGNEIAATEGVIWKSDFLLGRQCPRLLWYWRRAREEVDPPDQAMQCAGAFPEFANWVTEVENRIVDLLQPFRAFRYYHLNQGGSASMKKVLPALTGRGYEHLEIQDGQTASLEYLRVTFGDVSPEERRIVRKRLLDYCGLDTLGMVQIVEAMRRICGE